MTIPDQIGAAAETTHRLSLGRRVREIQLREVEPEVSHINAVRLVVRSADGRVTVHSAIDPRLARRDRNYAVLRRGEVLDLRFHGWNRARGQRRGDDRGHRLVRANAGADC
ncbi:hypothetical protein HLB44_29870 [Aquincola sp. S2]|uniref:Uncharacterized protein n=1 Tax=Pseudaquabacterium terrae TaxID=2732868 RepID=A0ABX2ERA4_9BURK|nr:hypothetical protein [Aquabacterium terrae]